MVFQTLFLVDEDLETDNTDNISAQTKEDSGRQKEVGKTLKNEVFTQRALIRKLNFEKTQRRLFQPW
jgi:hypothetical protein